MPIEVSLPLVLVGTALNIFGLACGARAFIIAHRTYGSGALLPWVGAALSSLRSLGRRMNPWVKRGSVVLASGAAGGAGVKASVREIVRTTFPTDLTDAERIEHLETAFALLYRELDEYHEWANERHTAVSERIDGLAVRLDWESRRLEALTREATTSDVRLQLGGLVAIAMGTILLALPTVWNLVGQL